MRERGRGSQEGDAEEGGESIKLDSLLPPEEIRSSHSISLLKSTEVVT